MIKLASVHYKLYNINLHGQAPWCAVYNIHPPIAPLLPGPWRGGVRDNTSHTTKTQTSLSFIMSTNRIIQGKQKMQFKIAFDLEFLFYMNHLENCKSF